MCGVHVVWPGEKFPWMTAITEAWNSVYAKWPPAKHAYSEGLHSSTARDSAEHAVCHVAGSAVSRPLMAWGKHTFCPVSTTPVSLECGGTPILSTGILSCFFACMWHYLPLKLFLWSLMDEILHFLQQEKNHQGTFCLTCFESSLVCGLHVHQSQEVWVMHWILWRNRCGHESHGIFTIKTELSKNTPSHMFIHYLFVLQFGENTSAEKFKTSR